MHTSNIHHGKEPFSPDPGGSVGWVLSRKATNSTPGQGTYLGCRYSLSRGADKKQHISVSLPLFFPPFPSKINLKITFKKNHLKLQEFNAYPLKLLTGQCYFHKHGSQH